MSSSITLQSEADSPNLFIKIGVVLGGTHWPVPKSSSTFFR
jgi:hypothetical protein